MHLIYAGRLQWNLLADEQANNPGYYTAGTYYGAYGDRSWLWLYGEHIRNMVLVHSSNPSPDSLVLSAISCLRNYSDKGVFTFNAEFKRIWTQNLVCLY